MLFTPVSGKLYLIGEKDYFDGSHSNYFKIGIVKNDREVEDRLFEHKTGNPRELVICHSLDSLAVEYLETSLHHRLATKVAQSEWFRLSKEEYDFVVNLAQSLSNDLDGQVPFVQKANELENKTSNGITLDADNEIQTLHLNLLPSRLLENKIDKIVGHVRETLAKRHVKSDTPNPGGTVMVEYDFPVFDTSKFLLEMPDEAAKYQKKKISSSFRISAPKEIKDEIENRNLVKEILDIDLSEVEMLNDRDLEQSRRELDQVQAEKSWLGTELEAKVKASVGENEAIKSIATWKRVEKSSFDPSALKKADPDLHAKFVQIQKRQRLVAVNAGQNEVEEE